jgi:hypothetical protein
MMFAKFSGRPIKTVISSVTVPASSKGTNVSTTSVTLRSTMNKSRLIEISAQSPASMNARTTVSPDS